MSRVKGYTIKEYRRILSNCGLDEGNLPDGVTIEGSHGNWWIVDNRFTLSMSNGGIYNVRPLGFSRGQVYVVCPNCKFVHWHGVPEGSNRDKIGSRVPHCSIDMLEVIPYNILPAI